eukprot:scaffold80141_cov63-Phaeocystis_antarctica.AAC.2
MSAYRDTAQHAAEAVSVGVAQGRSFIARCEDLDRQMLKVDALAGQVCVLAPPMGLVRRGSAVPSTAHIRWSSSEPLVRVRVGLTALIRTCPPTRRCRRAAQVRQVQDSLSSLEAALAK